jgi:hypothetical protein
MKIVTEISLINGYTNTSESDADIPLASNWHPFQYAAGDAVFMAAEAMHEAAGVGAGLSGNEKTEAINDAANDDRLGIEAVLDCETPEKWSANFNGRLIQNGVQIGTFSGYTSYRFD